MQRRLSTFNFKWLLRTGAFCLLVVLCTVLGGQCYKDVASANGINAFTKQRYDDFYALPAEDVDLLFCGSSHSYCTFDPANFPDYSAYQLGTPLQHPDTSYYALCDALEHQSPDIVVLEVYWDMLDDDFDLQQITSFFDVLDHESVRNEYFWSGFPLAEKVKYSISAIRYQASYLSYASRRIQSRLEGALGVETPSTEAENGVEYYQGYGYVYCDTVISDAEFDATNQFKGMDGANFSIAVKQRAYLIKIAQLCEENGITLLFVTAPIAPVSMEYLSNYDQIHRQVAELADELGVPYLDYNEVELGLSNTHFRDDAHLNDAGVKIVDAHFSIWMEQTLASLAEG